MVAAAKQIERNEDNIFKVIDRVLNQVFGREATLLIYRHLEHNYCLKRNQISERIEIFARGLEDFLRSGAYVVERKILEDVYSNSSFLRRMAVQNVNDEGDFVAQMKWFLHKS
jgi:hypothetical protein